MLDQRRPFELCRAQLGLQVDEPPLDLDVDRFVGTAEDEIGRASVSKAHGLLDARMPRRMGVSNDGLNGLELPAIPESDAVRGKEPEAELVAGR